MSLKLRSHTSIAAGRVNGLSCAVSVYTQEGCENIPHQLLFRCNSQLVDLILLWSTLSAGLICAKPPFAPEQVRPPGYEFFAIVSIQYSSPRATPLPQG